MLEALTPGERAAEIRSRCATLRTCLPSLSYVHIPHLPSAVIDLACHVGRQGGDRCRVHIRVLVLYARDANE